MPVSLTPWESFYVITGSAGAALTGLMFVVIALAADRVDGSSMDGIGAFSTPTVIHFSSVLIVAAVMAIPRHTLASLSICIGIGGLAGAVASIVAGRRMRRLQGYAAAHEDWLWHIILPFVCYVILVGSAIALPSATEGALTLIGSAVLALLVIGVHNAWDVAVYLAVFHRRQVAAVPAPTPPPPPPVEPPETP